MPSSFVLFSRAQRRKSLTMRYAHLSPDHKRVAMETLESNFSGKSPATFHNIQATIPSQGDQKRVAVH